MKKQIDLIFHEGNKETKETFDVKPMGIFQISLVSKEINSLLKDIKANEHLQNAISDFMKASKEKDEYNANVLQKKRENGIEEIYDGELLSNFDVLKSTGSSFIENVLGSFEILLENAPDRVINLLSIASGINNANILAEQDPYTFLDVFDAVVEVNDIPRLMERLKKSTNSLKIIMQATTTKKETGAK